MTDIVVPQMGESVAEGVIAAWLKKDGDFVASGEPLYELETDKITTEVPAPESGVLHIDIDEGNTVAIGAVIGKLEPGDKPAATTKSEQPAAAAKPKPAAAKTQAKPVEATPAPAAAPVQPTTQPTSQQASQPIVDLQSLSPVVRQLITQHRLNPFEIKGSGRHGRITKEDVEAVIAKKNVGAGTAVATPKPSVRQTAVDDDAEGATTRTRMSMLRQKIAQRLVNVQQQSAILTTFNEIDMSAVMNLRKQYKENFKEVHGVGLGLMSFFVKAVVNALKTWPDVNAFIDGTDIVHNHFYHIGIAVSTDRGLMVPVIRNADILSYAEIEQAIADYAQKARDGVIAVDDLQGGTFTISNGGIFGSLMATPILNPPQSGILGIHNIVKRPVVVDDEIVIRPMMYVALSYDHRIIDGRQSVGFLKQIKESVENPVKELFDM